MKKRVILKSPILTRSGYGEHARFVARALRAREDLFDIYMIPTPWGNTGWVWESDEEREWIDRTIYMTNEYIQSAKSLGRPPVFDISIQVCLPEAWEKMAPVNIGCTAGTETTKMSPLWVEKSNMMDKILVVSEHTKYAFVNTVYNVVHPQTGQNLSIKNNTPVEVTHYPALVSEEDNDFQIDLKHDFNFLCMAQWCKRKNFENTITWWLEKFHDKEVGLVIKGNNVKNSIPDREVFVERLRSLVKAFPNRKCTLHYLHGDMSVNELASLYKHDKIKCFINLAHGEGFGLPVFEAACYGLPVIAPNWGGVVDFLYAPLKGKMKPHFLKVDYTLSNIQPDAVWGNVLIKDSKWAFPKQGSYKSRLDDVYKNYGVWKKKAEDLREHVLEEFDKEKKYKNFVDCVLGYDSSQAEGSVSSFDIDNWISSLGEEVFD